MNKKIAVVCIIILSVAVCGILINRALISRKPFRDLSAADISSATVWVIPPDITVDLTGDEIAELTAILRTVVIYNRDGSYSEYAGQGVIYTLKRTDGSQLTVMAYNPLIVIDGIGYRTKYEPCEALNALGNTIRNKS